MRVNTKLNKVRPGRQWRRNEFFFESGGTCPARSPGKFWCWCRTPSLFWLYCDRQYSLVSLLFAVLLLAVPPRAQPFVNVGDGRGTCPLPYGVGATAGTVSEWFLCISLCMILLTTVRRKVGSLLKWDGKQNNTSLPSLLWFRAISYIPIHKKTLERRVVIWYVANIGTCCTL